MATIREDVRNAYNSMLAGIRDRSVQDKMKTFVSLTLFDSKIETVYGPTPVEFVQDLKVYPIRGSTALYDAVAASANTLSHNNKDASNLVLTFTDGEENSSFMYNAKRLREFIKEKEDLGNWTFTFQLPPRYADAFASRLGVSRENCREWEATKVGVQDMYQATSGALNNYFDSRSRGVKQVKTFYEVEADLSTVKTGEVKKKLKDLSKDFKVLTVDKEYPIKDFVELKTKKTYVIGSAYYQLTKTEKVQPTKSILVMEKGSSKVYGGNEARSLIGLPTNGSHAKVTPGNVGKWDIFVKSTSVNRKLVRGTRLLLDKTKTSDDQPTWTA